MGDIKRSEEILDEIIQLNIEISFNKLLINSYYGSGVLTHNNQNQPIINTLLDKKSKRISLVKELERVRKMEIRKEKIEKIIRNDHDR
jgi:hypothetical protein